MIDRSDALLQIVIAALAISLVRPVFAPEVRRDAPAELFVLLFLSIAITLVDWAVRDFELWPSSSVLRQYWGMSPAMTYTFCLIGAAMLLTYRKNRSRIALAAIMGIGAGWGLIESLGSGAASDPASPLRPIWTVIIPLVWIAVLLSPRVKRYCTGTVAVAA
jgi:hypothetical protein